MKARIFNIMQYENHPETHQPLLHEEKIIETVTRKGVKNYAYILHDKDVYSLADEEADPSHKQGEVKPPHWHIVIQAGYQMEIGTIAKWLGIAENFVDIPKGAGAGKFLDCVEYLTHESYKQQQLGKHRYNDIEVKSNFDFRTKLDRRNANKEKYGRDLEPKEQMMFDVMYNGKTLRQCMKEDKFLYMEIFERLQKLRMQYIASQTPPTTRINYYIEGKGGIGKGLLSRALARSLYPQLEDDEDIFFEVGAKGSAFEGYDGQPVIIWNDRRGIDLLEELKSRGNVFNVFDTHPTKQKQNVKYGSLYLNNEVNIVNSVEPSFDFLNSLVGEYTKADGTKVKSEKAQKSQSYRRFPFLIPIHQDDFDILINQGFMDDDSEKYEEYIQYKRVRGNMQRVALMCGRNQALVSEMEKRLMLPITEKHYEIKEKYDTVPEDEAAIREALKDYGTTIDFPIEKSEE